MLYRSFASFLLVIMALYLGACSSVVFKQPVGNAVEDEEQVQKLAGVWSTGPSEEVIFVQPLESGNIVIGGLSWKADQKKFVVKQATGVVTELDGDYYINLLDSEDPKVKDKYFVIRAKTSESKGHHLVLFPLDYTTFKQAVENGNLEGDISSGGGNSVTLTGSKNQIDDFMKQQMNHKFDLDDTIVVERVGEID
ncbi:MAG: hypothetical protein P8J86_10240 [Phycisphaerales bacterium]|nr:hypothetical protein [Phycisphaerales bacterium]